ncbi:hypothetical protein SEA_ROYALG_8 [Gordonia phage RoyalG]|uniref:Uncharacterized protein n=1 Tax=Gordonia phage RoyalG TaxID=2805837 RepID=A0A890UPR3_9CAUD|nr:hypothetical protein SEA_ROYALG_8 [Gordonia phage RoyalG]
MASNDDLDPSVLMFYRNEDVEKVTEVASRMNAFAQSLSLDGYGTIVLYPDNETRPCKECGCENP